MRDMDMDDARAGLGLGIEREMEGEWDEEDEEEDEETLQLQLQALQTKIKLKKLKAKQAQLEREAAVTTSPRKSHFDDTFSSSARSRMPPPPRVEVEVPTSPVRNERPPQEQLSPARRRLGLTSNPRAEDVSLKRARDPSALNRPNVLRSAPTLTQHAKSTPRPLSFNERLAESKEKEALKQARQDRLSSIRSTAFSKPKTTSTTNGTAVPTESAAEKALKARQRAQDITQNSLDAQSGARTGHAQDPSSDEDEDSLNILHNNSEGYDPFSKIHLKKRHIPHPVIAREMEGKEIYTLPRLLKEVKSPDYDPPDCESDFVVFAILASKSSPLDHAQTHKTAGSNPLEPAKNKFMVLKLVDLKWEIDCFLFGTAFTHFWKLTPGTLLAILNPAILPPKNGSANGKLSLKLGSSEDAVMEIGVARDLGLCSAIKRDGEGCGEWVDRRKTEACEFHVSLMVDKARKHRMEVNTVWRDPDGNKDDRIKSRTARGGRGGGRGGKGRYDREYGMLYSVPKGVGGRSTANAMDRDDTDALNSLGKEEASRKRMANAQRERDLARSLGEMGNGVGAAYLKATVTSTTTTEERTERIRRSERGGADERTVGEREREELFKKPSARELGLLGNVPESKRLSPPRERKSHFGLGLTTARQSNNNTVGWGGASKAGISGGRREVPPERGQTTLHVPSSTTSGVKKDGNTTAKTGVIRSRSQESSLRSHRSGSPVKKRARLQVPEKGIREPGRESLPGNAGDAKLGRGGAGGIGEGSDDDDELEIV